MFKKLPIAFALFSAAVGLGVAISVAGSVGAQPSEFSPTNPPPVPQIVNSDGTMNLKYFNGLRTWAPPGQVGRLITPSDFAPPNLTPAQIEAMTPAQRAAAHVGISR